MLPQFLGHQSTSGMRLLYVVLSSSPSLDFSSLSELAFTLRFESSTSSLMPFFNSRINLAIPFFHDQSFPSVLLKPFSFDVNSNRLDSPECTNFLPTFASHHPHLLVSMERFCPMCLLPPPPFYHTSIWFVLQVS